MTTGNESGKCPEKYQAWPLSGTEPPLAPAPGSAVDACIQLEVAYRFAKRIADNEHLGLELRGHAAILASSFESVGRRLASELRVPFMPNS